MGGMIPSGIESWSSVRQRHLDWVYSGAVQALSPGVLPRGVPDLA
jgi:hypothetical protein